MGVEAVKQIKLMVQDGMMPSSKPEFSEFGFDFSTDWETEISKSVFASAFGNTAKPMEGDLIYIPMMKRMWMVNGAYEEKNEGFMWQSSTFKVALVKYEDKGSVDLGDGKALSIQIEDHKVIGAVDKISSKDLNNILKWIDMNKELLLKYWNDAHLGTIDNGDVIDNVKKIE